MAKRGPILRFCLTRSGKVLIWEIFSKECTIDLIVRTGNQFLLSRISARFSRGYRATISNRISRRFSDSYF